MFRDLLTGIIIRAMIAKGRLDVKRMHRQALYDSKVSAGGKRTGL